MIRTTRLSLIPLFAITLWLPLHAQSPRELRLLPGKGELLTFANDVIRVAISEPKVADAVVVSPREVLVNAKGEGATTLLIWETGANPVRFDVVVYTDVTGVETMRANITRALKAKNIDLAIQGDTVVLTGVADAEESKRIAEAVAPLGKNVVNLLRAPDPKSPRQVMLQVKFASVDRVALKELGFNYFSRNDTVMGTMSTQQFSQPRFSQLQFQDGKVSGGTINFADLLNLFLYRPDLNIGSTIRALQGRNLLQILAEPNLITVEGKEASFLAGGQFPFPVIASTSSGGSVAPVVTVQFKNFGVELIFTPTITHDEKIHLKVNPSVSALDYSNSVQIQGFLIPAISTRTATTEVELKDGESFAIAGLLDSRVIQSVNKIPWLGQVPILGALFSSRSTRKTQDELLVVITPHFVKPLSAEEKAQLPTTIEPFLQTADQEMAKKQKKGAKGAKPEFSGPIGHQQPVVKGARPEKEKRQ